MGLKTIIMRKVINSVFATLFNIVTESQCDYSTRRQIGHDETVWDRVSFDVVRLLRIKIAIYPGIAVHRGVGRTITTLIKVSRLLRRHIRTYQRTAIPRSSRNNGVGRRIGEGSVEVKAAIAGFGHGAYGVCIGAESVDDHPIGGGGIVGFE